MYLKTGYLADVKEFSSKLRAGSSVAIVLDGYFISVDKDHPREWQPVSAPLMAISTNLVNNEFVLGALLYGEIIELCTPDSNRLDYQRK